jgi:hypothetical protein
VFATRNHGTPNPTVRGWCRVDPVGLTGFEMTLSIEGGERKAVALPSADFGEEPLSIFAMPFKNSELRQQVFSRDAGLRNLALFIQDLVPQAALTFARRT